MLGSWVKQRTGTAAAIASQPMLSDNCVTMASRVTPSSVGRPAGFLLLSMRLFYMGKPAMSVYNALLIFRIHFS